MKNCSRQLLAPLVCALLAAGVLACGGASKSTSTSTNATASGGHLKEDGDKDSDDAHGSGAQDDEAFLASYGPQADPATTRAIAEVLRSYYAASLAGNGAAACGLLNAALATALASQQSQAGGTSACAAAIAPVLAQQHQRLLAEEPATMSVIGVHVKGSLGLAVLGFKRSPESVIVVTRTGNVWKIDALFDSLLR
jgi:hypothetical protein